MPRGVVPVPLTDNHGVEVETDETNPKGVPVLPTATICEADNAGDDCVKASDAGAEVSREVPLTLKITTICNGLFPAAPDNTSTTPL
jgi:hypothetical protein